MCGFIFNVGRSMASQTIVLPPEQRSYVTLPRDEIEEIERLFVKAEQKIKSIEHDGDGLDIPSINELRYAGRHLLTALKNNNLDELAKAKNHVKRALYDACEVLIISNLEEIKQFQNDYRLVTITDVVKDFTSLMIKAEAARQFIQNKDAESREDYYDECSAQVDILREVNITLKTARADLNVKIADRRTTTIRWAIGIGVSAILAIGAWTVAIVVKLM